MRERIYLCLAHMSGKEQVLIKEAFDTNWVVPMGPNVNGFEKDLEGGSTRLRHSGRNPRGKNGNDRLPAQRQRGSASALEANRVYWENVLTLR